MPEPATPGHQLNQCFQIHCRRCDALDRVSAYENIAVPAQPWLVRHLACGEEFELEPSPENAAAVMIDALMRTTPGSIDDLVLNASMEAVNRLIEERLQAQAESNEIRDYLATLMPREEIDRHSSITAILKARFVQVWEANEMADAAIAERDELNRKATAYDFIVELIGAMRDAGESTDTTTDRFVVAWSAMRDERDELRAVVERVREAMLSNGELGPICNRVLDDILPQPPKGAAETEKGLSSEADAG